MDFASLMAKEIAKSKPPSTKASEAKEQQQQQPATKSFVRRAELEAARIAAYEAEQERIQKEREARLERKRKLDEEEAERNRIREEKRRRLAEESRRKREAEEESKEAERRKRLGLSVTPTGTPGTPGTRKSGDEGGKQGTEDEESLSAEQLTERLRSFGEPVQLFGEGEKGRLKRYRRLTQRSVTPQKKLTDGPIPTTLELLPEAEMKVPEKVPADEEGRKYLFRQLASYFTMVLKEWEIALAKRDDSVKSTFQGRQAYNAMVQSKENMRPLFKKFENADMEESILGPIVEIVGKAQNRRYVDANDAYLRLSIGKA